MRCAALPRRLPGRAAGTNEANSVTRLPRLTTAQLPTGTGFLGRRIEPSDTTTFSL